MEAMKVYRRGLERSALVMRGSRTVAEVFTDREPGDQYETAELFATAPGLLAALQGLLLCAEARGDAEPLDAYETRRKMMPGQIARAYAVISQVKGGV